MWSHHKIRIITLAVTVVVIAAFGLLIAKTVTRPMDVELRTHIKICQKAKKGNWEVIDEVGPANLRFHANLIEMASGKKIGTDYVWNTRTKKGKPYRVKLVEPAKTNLNAVSGRFDVDLIFEITYDGRQARVPSSLTTESTSGPLGAFKGQRVKGLLGRDRTSMKLVSVNKFQPTPKSKPLMLVCTEEYKLSPRK